MTKRLRQELNNEFDFSTKESLLQNGIAVIPYNSNILDTFNLQDFLTNQKEFKESNEDTLFVMGGFGALGNPSSFHHPEVRQLRFSIYQHMFNVFKELFPGRYLECLVDRFCIRKPGTSLSKETWHRDISNTLKGIQYGSEDDVIYGGWVNLDRDLTQYFSCVPRTHTEIIDQSGFARLSKEEAAEYKHRRYLVAIPPHHVLVFNEKTVHEVLPMKQKHTSYRLFMKYRVSTEEAPLFDTISEIIENQGVFPLSYAQVPPLYGKLHWCNWKSRLQDFSANIRAEFIDPTKEVVYRFMPSLREANMELFPPYSESDKSMLKPQLLV